MTMNPKKVQMWVLTVCCAVSLSVVGCAKKPSAEQLAALEEARRAASAAEKAAQDCQNDNASLESQLSQKKRELQEAKDELAAVKSRLQ